MCIIFYCICLFSLARNCVRACDLSAVNCIYAFSRFNLVCTINSFVAELSLCCFFFFFFFGGFNLTFIFMCMISIARVLAVDQSVVEAVRWDFCVSRLKTGGYRKKIYPKILNTKNSINGSSSTIFNMQDEIQNFEFSFRTFKMYHTRAKDRFIGEWEMDDGEWEDDDDDEVVDDDGDNVFDCLSDSRHSHARWIILVFISFIVAHVAFIITAIKINKSIVSIAELEFVYRKCYSAMCDKSFLSHQFLVIIIIFSYSASSYIFLLLWWTIYSQILDSHVFSFGLELSNMRS